MFLNIIILIVGFVLLIKSADYLVNGAASLAKKLGISSLVIGLTIVALGTSAPELIVNIISSYQGQTDLAIGNVLGSNICNILLILGVCGVIRELAVPSSTTWKEIPFALLAVLVLGILAFDNLFAGQSNTILSLGDGLIFLCFFAIFLYYTFSISKNASQETKVKKYSNWLAALMIIGGLVGLVIGGKLIVDSAVSIARTLGVSEALIGLTIVAIGTSLPELATSAVAAYKKQTHLAIGNIVGSNIFNIFFILGVSSVIRPLPFSMTMTFDFIIVIATTLLLFMFMLIGKKYVLQRWQGAAFLLLYLFYVGFLIYRG